MKKLLLLFIPLLSYGQTADEFLVSGKEKADLRAHAEAIIDFTKAIELAPENADAYYFRGYSEYKSRAYDKAIEDLSQTIALDVLLTLEEDFRSSN